jgi:hypothetical protein
LLRRRQSLSYSKISQIFWNPKVHYRVQNCMPLVPILSQMNPINTTPSYLNIHFIIILPLRSRSCYWPLSFWLSPTNILHTFLFSPLCSSCPSHKHVILLDFSFCIWLRVKSVKLLVMQIPSASCYVIPLGNVTKQCTFLASSHSFLSVFFSRIHLK